MTQPMRSWSYIEPLSESDMTPVKVTMTEQEILETYYPYWQEQMRKVGKADQISPEACIEDWVVIHWAEEETG